MKMIVFLKTLMTNICLIFVRDVTIMSIRSDCSVQWEATQIMHVTSSSYKI